MYDYNEQLLEYKSELDGINTEKGGKADDATNLLYTEFMDIVGEHY